MSEWNFQWIPDHNRQKNTFVWNHKKILQVLFTIPLARRDPSLHYKFFLSQPRTLRFWPTIAPFAWISTSSKAWKILVFLKIYFLAVHTISLTQLHLPPTGSKAKYDGHWYIEPTIPVPGFRKQLTNFLHENGCGNTPTSKQCGSPSAVIRTWKIIVV